MTRGVLAGVAVLALAGCVGDRGGFVPGDDAADYFQMREDAYVRIVSLVDQCRPIRSGDNAGYNRVWADGSHSAGLGCLNPGYEVEPIQMALRSVDAVSVFYLTDDGPMARSPSGEMAVVKIGVHSSGIVPSGRSVDFVYSAEPLDASPPNESDEGYAIERRLVGSAPHHWYWESSKN